MFGVVSVRIKKNALLTPPKSPNPNPLLLGSDFGQIGLCQIQGQKDNGEFTGGTIFLDEISTRNYGSKVLPQWMIILRIKG